MLLEFSIFPVGAGASLSKHVAKAIKIVHESGLPYLVNPMGTIVEGEFDEIMSVVKKCYEEMMKENERIAIYIKIDARKGRKGELKRKIESIKEKINFEMKV